MVGQKQLVIVMAVVLTAIILIKFFYLAKLLLEPLKAQERVDDLNEKHEQKN